MSCTTEHSLTAARNWAINKVTKSSGLPPQTALESGQTNGFGNKQILETPFCEVKQLHPTQTSPPAGESSSAQSLTEDGELLVSLQGLLPGEGEVEPAGAGHVELHGAAEDLQVGGSSLDGLGADLDPHARHHHRAVVVGHFDGETPRLQRTDHRSKLPPEAKECLLLFRGASSIYWITVFARGHLNKADSLRQGTVST